MSVKFKGITNLLTGFYKDIVINETDTNINIKINPDKLSPSTLDEAFYHTDYSSLSDDMKVKTIIDSFLNNNNIHIVTSLGKLKHRTNQYFAVNAYETYIDGLKTHTRALYLNLHKKELKDEYKRIILKYEEDRIRHLDEILKCRTIKILPDTKMSAYIIDGDTALITLISDINPNRKYLEKVKPLRREDKFLKEILMSFYKKNGLVSGTSHGDFNIELYGENQTIIMDDRFMKCLYDAYDTYEKLSKDIKTITIDEYLKEKEYTKK